MSADSGKLHNDKPVELAPSTAEDQVVALLAQDPGPQVRVRLLGQLYDVKDRNYVTWKGVSWRLKVDSSLENLRRVRAALQLCMEALATLGPEQLMHVLKAAMPEGPTLPISTVEEEDANG